MFIQWDIVDEGDNAIKQNQHQNFPDICETTHHPHSILLSASQTSGPSTTEEVRMMYWNMGSVLTWYIA